MSIWITSDTHFNHERLKTLGAGRPDDYEERLWRSMDRMGNEEDTLIHLGDICIGKDAEVHERLSSYRFKKILVKGNHDTKSDAWYYKHGWDFVCIETVIRAFGKLILLRHIPIGVEHKDQLDLHIHGHFHGSADRPNRVKGGVIIGGGHYDDSWHYDVAPDIHNFQVVSLKSIVEAM